MVGIPVETPAANPAAFAALGIALGAYVRPQAYTGYVATDCRHPDAINAGAAKQFNTRSAHFMRDQVDTMQVAWANNYGTSEAGPGGSLSVTDCFIEYPIGTFTRVTWSGANSVVVASGDDSPLSDPHAAPPIGALFFYRAFLENANGVPYSTVVSPTPINGTGAEFAASGLTSKAGGGSIAASSTYVSPCLIVGSTTRHSIAIFGDSIAEGVGETVLDLTGDTGILARGVGPHFAYNNMGRSGERISAFVGSTGAKRRARAAYASMILSNYGRNDLTASTTAAALAALVTTMAGQFPGKPFYQATVTPIATSTDSFATVANQTTAVSNPARVSFNQMVRANSIPGMTCGLDVSSVLESSVDSGLWTPGMVTVADGLHPSTAGYLAVARAGVITPARLSLGV